MGRVLRPFGNIVSPGTRQVPTGQVAIDWSHPLANGLIGCWLPGVTGPVDVTHQTPDLSLQSSAANVRDLTQEGGGLKSTASSSGYDLVGVPSSYLSWTGFTIYWRGYLFGVPPVAGSLYAGINYNSAATAPYIVVALGYNTNFYLYYSDSGTLVQFNTTIAPAAGFESIGATFSGVTLGKNYFYQKGALKATSGALTTAPSSSATSTLCVNADHNDATRNPNGICNICCFWNRQLSDSDMAWVDREPYSFLMPAESEMPVIYAPAVPSIILGYTNSPMGSIRRIPNIIGY